MPPLPRRPLARPAAAAPAQAAMDGINFGSLSIYVAGGGLPEGDYALEFAVRMYQATNQQGVTRGPERLGVMVTAHSLTDPNAEPRDQFYSMGRNAHLSFAPNPDTGKGLVPVPGGAGTTLNNSTNWHFFLKSLYDCGLPDGVFVNDLSVLDGVWVHITNVPEPEERKGFGGAQTGEVAEERRAGTIGVVSEILQGGAPWDGGGGFETAPAPAPAARRAAPARAGALATTARPAARAAAPAARPAARAAAPAARPVARRAAAPPPEPEPVEGEVSDDDIIAAAVSGIEAVLSDPTNAKGISRLKLRTGAFKAISESQGDDMAQAVQEMIFVPDDQLNAVLGELGYQLKGTNITPLPQA